MQIMQMRRVQSLWRLINHIGGPRLLIIIIIIIINPAAATGFRVLSIDKRRSSKIPAEILEKFLSTGINRNGERSKRMTSCIWCHGHCRRFNRPWVSRVVRNNVSRRHCQDDKLFSTLSSNKASACHPFARFAIYRLVDGSRCRRTRQRVKKPN